MGHYLVAIPLYFWRYVIGPLNDHVFVYFHFAVVCFIIQVLLNRFESHALHLISVVILKRMPLVIDDFMARFLACFNLVISSLMALFQCFSTLEDFGKLRYTGRPTFLVQEKLDIK